MSSRPALCLLVLTTLTMSIVLQAAEPPPPSVFDLPGVQIRHAVSQQAVTGFFASGQYAEAEKLLRKMIDHVPRDFNAHYNLACALARQGKKDEALASLEQAVALGFRDPQHVEQDADLQTLRGDARFTALVKKAGEPLPAPPAGWKYEVKPNEPADGQALVTEGNVAWNAQLGVFQAFFKIDPAATQDKPIAAGFGKAGDLLREWAQDGTAAGNHGDLYDNHDSDHANMNYAFFPQLTRIEFSAEAKQRHLHHGLQQVFLYNGVTIGNSSTALTSGPFWRCQGRHALTQPRVPVLLYVQYVGNHLYVYPEHRDHDPGHNGNDGKGHGDVFPANTPYLIISQGSSGSDVAFLNAVAATLAAFRPEVKQHLAKAGTLMPTVQMLFRMSNQMVQKPEDYLTGKAHPTVFDGRQINAEKMVTLAHALKSDSLPPMVQLRVVEEDEPVVGRDYFDVGPREKLFDTPCAIARVVKATKYVRRMVVSAEASKDLHGKPLSYHWVVLRGDAERIRINKLEPSGARVELLVPYHERRPTAAGAELESNRVDIGAFVHNGDYYSAPGFISFTYLDNEKRTYDGQQRITVVDYTDPAAAGNYVDPQLDFRKDWRDEYRYGDDGKLLGWTRTRGQQREEFTPDGLLVMEKDATGRPTQTKAVRYVAKLQGDRAPVLEQQLVEAAQR